MEQKTSRKGIPSGYKIEGFYADIWNGLQVSYYEIRYSFLSQYIIHFGKTYLIHLQASLNFSYVITKPADGTWGNPTENGSWTGIIGHLQKGETDVGKKMQTIGIHMKNIITFIL